MKPYPRWSGRSLLTCVVLMPQFASPVLEAQVPTGLAAQPATAHAETQKNPTANATDSTVIRMGAAVLSDWITLSRDEALAQGVQPIPPEIRSAISGYVPDDILQRVRWGIGSNDQISLQSNSFYFAETPAITLDYVIVFRDTDVAHDVELWVHELRHVIQFREWGIDEFAVRYISDRSAVESDASRYRWGWVFRPSP